MMVLGVDALLLFVVSVLVLAFAMLTDALPISHEADNTLGEQSPRWPAVGGPFTYYG